MRFFVAGVPVPKGSARAFWNKRAGKVVTMQDNREKQRPWASMISLCAQRADVEQRSEFVLGRSGAAVVLRLDFAMPRPKAHYRRSGEVKPGAPQEHTKKPDLDKLIRCVKDALSGIAYADDSQVVRVEAAKSYVAPEDAHRGQPGCDIEIEYEQEA